MRSLRSSLPFIVLAALIAYSPVNAQTNKFDFRFGEDVNEDVQAFVRKASFAADNFFAENVGVSVPDKTKVFVSGDPKFLARSFAEHTGAKNNAQVLKDWTSVRENAGMFGALFVRTNSASFNVSRGGSLQAQRTRIFVHELFHVVQFGLVGPRSKNCCAFDKIPVIGPTWLVEGAAQYMMYFNEGSSNLAGWRTWAEQQRRGFKGSLKSFETRKGINADPNAYDISALAVEKLVNSTSLKALGTYWRRIGEGRTWQQAFKDAFTVTPAEFYAAF